MIFKCKQCKVRYWTRDKAKDCEATDKYLKRSVMAQRINHAIILIARRCK